MTGLYLQHEIIPPGHWRQKVILFLIIYFRLEFEQKKKPPILLPAERKKLNK